MLKVIRRYQHDPASLSTSPLTRKDVPPGRACTIHGMRRRAARGQPHQREHGSPRTSWIWSARSFAAVRKCFIAASPLRASARPRPQRTPSVIRNSTTLPSPRCAYCAQCSVQAMHLRIESVDRPLTKGIYSSNSMSGTNPSEKRMYVLAYASVQTLHTMVSLRGDRESMGWRRDVHFDGRRPHAIGTVSRGELPEDVMRPGGEAVLQWQSVALVASYYYYKLARGTVRGSEDRTRGWRRRVRSGVRDTRGVL